VLLSSQELFLSHSARSQTLPAQSDISGGRISDQPVQCSVVHVA